MWRSFFLAVGIFAIVLGGEALVVDQVTFASNRRIPAMVAGRGANNGATGNSNQFNLFNRSPFQNVGYGNQPNGQPAVSAGKKSFKTKDWMPWSLLASGTIIVMYICSLPPGTSKSSFSSDD